MNRIKSTILLALVSAAMSVACSVDRPQALNASVAAPADPIFAEAQAEVARRPDSPMAFVNLAALYMKESRRTGDFYLNQNAADAVAKALELDPNNVPARKLEASLHLAKHRFAEAVESAEKMKEELPSDSFIYGILADAYVETGNYEKAVAAAQKMVDLKPGTASYSRVAQLRSLHGDHKGAVEMFVEAARAADPSDKETQSWCLVQLGDEHWKQGKYAEAERVYDEALANFPGYFLALVSKGRARASQGDHLTAEQILNQAQSKVPNANATLLLGDIYALRGENDRAMHHYEEFDRMQERLGDAADHKRLVISWADRGMIDKALEMAQSEYAAEKSIHSADLLAWTLYRAGRAGEAKPYVLEAMRLGTNDARTIFHAGMIAHATGDTAEARRLLNRSLEINPAFDLVQAQEARRVLASLG